MASTLKITSDDIQGAWAQVMTLTENAEFNEDATKEFIAEIQYRGVNPAILALTVLGYGSQRPHRKNDIIQMIILGTERGNNIDGMIKKSTPAAITIITELKNTYNLVSKADKDVNAITLSRVALAFPHLACEYANIATSRAVLKSSLTDDYPLYMTHPAFANMIPVNDKTIKETLVEIHLLYQVMLTHVINKNLGNMTLDQIREQATTFIKYGYSSSYPEESVRVKYLIKWNILTDAKTLSDNTKRVLDLVKDKFADMASLG